MELAWTVIPVLIVVALFLASARVIASVQNAPRPPGAFEVIVTGHQYWWEYRYPQLEHRHSQRTACAGQRSGASNADIPDAALRRYRPQFLGAASGRQDRSDSESPQSDVDRSARNRPLPGAVRAVLRNAARQDAAARLCAIARGVRALGSRATAVAADATSSAGQRVFESTACVNCHTVSGTPAKGTVRPGPDSSDEPRHDRRRARRPTHPKCCASGFRIRTPSSLDRKCRPWD